MTTRTKRTIGLGTGVVLVALAVFVVLWNLGGRANITTSPAPVAGANQYVVPANQPEPVADLTGKWIYKGTDGLAFAAEVKNGGISIDLLTGDGTSMTYWVGTFKNEANIGSVIKSVVDTNEVVLSMDPAKDFTVDEGSLSFKFQAMGVKKTIVMTR